MIVRVVIVLLLWSLWKVQVNVFVNCRKQGEKSSVDKEGNDADANFDQDNADDEFLSLDDLQEGRNLNLKEDFDSREVEDFKLVRLCQSA